MKLSLLLGSLSLLLLSLWLFRDHPSEVDGTSQAQYSSSRHAQYSSSRHSKKRAQNFRAPLPQEKAPRPKAQKIIEINAEPAHTQAQQIRELKKFKGRAELLPPKQLFSPQDLQHARAQSSAVVERCYGETLSRDPDLAGDLRLRLLLKKGGEEARFHEHHILGGLGDPVLERCVLKGLASVAWPALGQGELILHQSFPLQPEEK